MGFKRGKECNLAIWIRNAVSRVGTEVIQRGHSGIFVEEDEMKGAKLQSRTWQLDVFLTSL